MGDLEADKHCNVPEMDPIVERAASMHVPILQYAHGIETGRRLKLARRGRQSSCGDDAALAEQKGAGQKGPRPGWPRLSVDNGLAPAQASAVIS